MWLRRNSNSEWKLCAVHYCDRRINTNQSCTINCKRMLFDLENICGKRSPSLRKHPNHAEPTSLG